MSRRIKVWLRPLSGNPVPCEAPEDCKPGDRLGDRVISHRVERPNNCPVLYLVLPREEVASW